MNIKYIDENYDLSVFVNKFGSVVDWHYGTDFDDVDEDYWEREWTQEAGNAGIFKDAMRAIEKGCDELPNVYLTTTRQEKTYAEGPVLLLIEWPIMDEGCNTPCHLFSVHTTDNGCMFPPLPPVLADRLAKAMSK